MNEGDPDGADVSADIALCKPFHLRNRRNPVDKRMAYIMGHQSPQYVIGCKHSQSPEYEALIKVVLKGMNDGEISTKAEATAELHRLLNS